MCSLEACERGLFAIRGGSDRNHFSCSRGVGFTSCSKSFRAASTLSSIASLRTCLPAYAVFIYLVTMASQDFISTVALTDLQKILTLRDGAFTKTCQFVERLTGLGERSLREWGASLLSPTISCTLPPASSASLAAVCVAALLLLLLRQRHDIFLGSTPSLGTNFPQRVGFVTVRQCRVVKPAGFWVPPQDTISYVIVFLREQGSGAA